MSRRFRAVLCALLGLLIAVLTLTAAAQPALAKVPGMAVNTYTYDGHRRIALTESVTERGPPPGRANAVASAADGQRPVGVPARPDDKAATRDYEYDDRDLLGQIAHDTRRAERQAKSDPTESGIFVPFGVAANAGAKLPEALTLGKNAEEGVHVYYGTSGGKNVYAGITNNVERRGIEHGDRFVLNPITTEGLTRGEARAVEQALIVRNPGFENIRNGISPNHAWYQDAVDWGEAWLQGNGY